LSATPNHLGYNSFPKNLNRENMKKLLSTTLLAAAILSGCATESSLNEKAGIRVEKQGNDVRVVLPNAVLFDFGQSTLSANSEQALTRSATLLNRTKAMVLVEGHTDNVGTAQANQELSEERAVTVAQNLARRNVAADRMQAKGYSFSKPIATNDTEEGRRLNRRTDIVILNETVENIMKK
jgi:outer membrane protein OmpA-like peptidoglycan-associated protein